MLAKLKSIQERYKELEELLVREETFADKDKYQIYAKELSKLSKIVERIKLLDNKNAELKDLEHLFSEQHDESFLDLAKTEIAKLREEISALNSELESLFSQEAADKQEELIMEIRAGTGGQEASLFVGDLYRMYTKYADARGFKYEVMASHPTDSGGFKEVIFSIAGLGAYKNLKYESGVHRVQRVPATEASGRIHTSTVTVAVLVEPQEVDLVINPQDLKIDVYRSKGAGGQSVNTTDSAVRITHLPTGLVVTCQDERSQLKNKNKAMRVLRARLLAQIKQEDLNKMTSERRSQVGTGERSEKIRTYNFPDRRITDHRVNLTIYKLEAVLDGEIDEFIKVLQENEKKEKVETEGKVG